MKGEKKRQTLARTILLGTNIPIVLIIALMGILSTLQLEHMLGRIAEQNRETIANYAAVLVTSHIETITIQPGLPGVLPDMVHIRAVLESMDHGESRFVMLLDSEDGILAGGDRFHSFFRSAEAAGAVLTGIRSAVESPGSVYRYTSEQGPVTALIRPIPGFGLTIVVHDYASAYSGIIRTFRFLVFASILAASLVVSILIRLILRKTLAPMRIIRGISNSVADGDLSSRIPLKSNDEIGDLASFFNTVIDSFAELVEGIRRASGILLDSIHTLTAGAQEVSRTASQQAAAASEVVSTMEDVDTLSKNVAVRIREVVKIATTTRESVQKGFSLIKESLDKMNEIRETNGGTIGGIKTLGGQIDSIWEIVNIINGIADQTKIIAFNAELEAASAGEAGKNFQIVAGEIRRLADSTVDSTNEIKTRIHEIQHASDKLIIASEEGTRKIGEGWETSHNIRGVFEEVLSSSEISAASAEDIARSIKMQVASFEQIFLTLKQISEGINSFAASTRNTSDSSDRLKAIAEQFGKTIERYRTGENSNG